MCVCVCVCVWRRFEVRWHRHQELGWGLLQRALYKLMLEGLISIMYVKTERRVWPRCCMLYVDAVSCIRWVYLRCFCSNVEEFPGLLFCTDNKPLVPLKNTCYLLVLCLCLWQSVNATVVVFCSIGILNLAGSPCGAHSKHSFLSEPSLLLRQEAERWWV